MVTLETLYSRPSTVFVGQSLGWFIWTDYRHPPLISRNLHKKRQERYRYECRVVGLAHDTNQQWHPSTQ